MAEWWIPKDDNLLQEKEADNNFNGNGWHTPYKKTIYLQQKFAVEQCRVLLRTRVWQRCALSLSPSHFFLHQPLYYSELEKSVRVWIR